MVLLILEPFVLDGDILSPGSKFCCIYDLSYFRVIMVVLCTCDEMMVFGHSSIIVFLGFRTCSLFILISGLLYKASLGLLNMFIGIESHTLIVTNNIARLSYGD